jgi:aminodeoxyfutalosine deaminase
MGEPTRDSERGTRNADGNDGRETQGESPPPRSADCRPPTSDFAQLGLSFGDPVALRARLVFTVAGHPLTDGVVTIAGERIVAVGENASARPPVDLGNVALLPGLVNAHTHLEFSNLDEPLGTAGNSLPDWIRKVIAGRRNTAAGEQSANVQLGLAEAVRTGTTTIGEIATAPWPPAAGTPADMTVFHESIGLLREQIDERHAAARAYLDRSSARCPGYRLGLSPHAPYSVHPELLRRLAALAGKRQVSLAMHLAESREELELLAAGSGPFRTLLDDLQAWSPQAIPPGSRPLDYLRQLIAAPRSLVIHGNYLTADELEFLAAHGDRLAVVYCPRTHAFFGHPRYPLAEMLAADVQVAIGTDSRASNPDLSLLDELRFIARHYPELAPQTVLELGTLAGARALGLAAETGSLVPGKLANLAVAPLPDRDSSDPYELLFDSSLPASQTWHRGKQIF